MSSEIAANTFDSRLISEFQNRKWQ